MVPKLPNSKKDPFDSIYFWIKVVKLSLIIFVPYWLFGFETGLFVGIIVICLFLSKISLTVQELNEYLAEKLKAKPAPKTVNKPGREGKTVI